MKREDEELLLKDLCSRLPYGVKCLVNYTFCNETTDYKDVKSSEVDTLITINQQTESYFFENLSEWFDVDEFKPYLLPISSMTYEQKEKYCQFRDKLFFKDKVPPRKDVTEFINFFYENNLDFNGLIPMGLAIDATGLNIY